MFKAEKTLTLLGVSSTGTKHGLLIETCTNDVRFTVTGANGKRHASVILADADGDVISMFLRGVL
jgi:hypothetical protein